MARRRCPKCGKFISDTATFCIFCSTAIMLEEPEEESEDNLLEEEIVQHSMDTIPMEMEDVEEKSDIQEDSKITSVMEPEEKTKNKDQIEEETDYDVDDDVERNYTSPIADDDAAFNKILKRNAKASINAGKSEATNTDEKQKEKKIEKEQSKIPKIIKTHEKKYEQKVSEKQADEINRYNPNEDGYYDAMITMIDARIDHITKENVVSTIALASSVILVIGFMIYFVL